MKEFFEIAGQVAGLAGISLVVFLAISKAIVGKTREVNQGQSYKLLNRLLIFAVIITVLGMISWLVSLSTVSEQAVRIEVLDSKLAEISTARDDLKRELENERKRTSDLIALNKQLANLLDRFSTEHSADTLTSSQSEIIASAAEIRQLALAEIEKRLGGRSALLARLQSIHPNQDFSVENTLSLASFSLRMYRSDASRETHEAVLSTLRGLEADVIAIQEVADEASLSRLTNALPEYQAVLGATSHYPFRSLILYHKERVSLLSSEELPFGRSAAPRKPLVAEFEANGIPWLLVNLHLKSNYGGVSQNAKRRMAALNMLAEWIEDNQNRPIIVTGVFQSGTDAPEMRPLLDINGTFATNELPKDVTTFITDRQEWRGIYSHFVFFGAINKRYIDGSIYVHDLEELLPELTRQEIKDSISDHSPISIAINIQS